MLGPEVWRLAKLCDLRQVTTLSEFQFPPLETGGQKTNLGLSITAVL